MDTLKISQNFLHNTDTVKKIISLSNIEADDLVYEIGPGKGIITKELANACKSVTAIEFDKGLAQKLKATLKENKKIDIIEGDFLKYGLPVAQQYKIFSNIPFNITAEIIQKITNCVNPPTDSYLIVQQEPAIKYAGAPYGRETFRSLLLKPLFQLSIMHSFSKTDFHPIPNANIVLLHIALKKEIMYDMESYKKYKDFIAYSFMRNAENIKSCFKDVFSYEQIKRLGREHEFDMKANINQLFDTQWMSLFDFFFKSVVRQKQEIIDGSYAKLLKQQDSLEKRHRNVQRR